MEILVILLVFVAGYILGWIRGTSSIARKLLEEPDRIMGLVKEYKANKLEENTPTQNSTSRKLKVERHGDMLYVFAEDNDQFLAQGKTLQEALDIIEKRFPKTTFVGHLDKDQADSLGITVK